MLRFCENSGETLVVVDVEHRAKVIWRPEVEIYVPVRFVGHGATVDTTQATDTAKIVADEMVLTSTEYSSYPANTAPHCTAAPRSPQRPQRRTS